MKSSLRAIGQILHASESPGGHAETWMALSHSHILIQKVGLEPEDEHF